MKSSGFIILVLVGLLIHACEVDVPIPAEPDPCGAVDLGVTEVAIQPDPELAAQVSSFDSAWTWRRIGDTLIVKYREPGWCTAGQIRYLNFIISDCPTLVRDYTYSYNVILADTPIFSSNIRDYDLNFQLQQWKEGEILVGKNNDTEIWLELNADNMY